ncbi:TetR/AcrR family transcriptional regulator [Brachybacterium saurashtrense]|uniref:TetR/AcrR family transcriptional regulator n=1 Tax=Brachybacterium saurashtrense TaxID=556288 RepID=A0A345YRK2_9MICO|nr:TetR/AcrR family transcriptional regulator C-terminal domain-containing protein [Brachybacterium saurashtrense]AXK46554.1 TetR/AcrR family transcriptional regulator [Brachybacterium saurashtrense]RRR24295.1 TetR/AcrR family transcriptional regulator [Brachybacterium saurashtrense]
MATRAPTSRRERPAKPALSREAIVEAALRVLERDGAEKLTIRRVADELDTGPASLYVYVKNVTVLHALLVDGLLADLDLTWDGDEPWRERLHRLIADYIGLLTVHGNLARSAMFVWPEGPHYLSLIDVLLRLLRTAGLDEKSAAWGIDLLLQHASITAAEWAARSSGTGQEIGELAAALASADPERHSTLAAFGTATFTQGTPEERHRWALDTLLEGITHRRP